MACIYEPGRGLNAKLCPQLRFDTPLLPGELASALFMAFWATFCSQSLKWSPNAAVLWKYSKSNAPVVIPALMAGGNWQRIILYR
jgi:hypothetical protein